MVAEIRELCKKNGTSIKALEKELGFGNGTISRWDKNAPAIDKVQAVANHFNVPLSYLTVEEQKRSPPQGGEPPAITDWEKALDGKSKKELKEIIDIAMKKFMEQQ